MIDLVRFGNLKNESISTIRIKINAPAILIGDFNMSFKQTQTQLFTSRCHFLDWIATSLTGNIFIYIKKVFKIFFFFFFFLY